MKSVGCINVMAWLCVEEIKITVGRAWCLIQLWCIVFLMHPHGLCGLCDIPAANEKEIGGWASLIKIFQPPPPLLTPPPPHPQSLKALQKYSNTVLNNSLFSRMTPDAPQLKELHRMMATSAVWLYKCLIQAKNALTFSTSPSGGLVYLGI